mmetsp:Transcript_25323/g.50726  ORF Transcript_25323/g.50726 Transcript_25323/m.50726 type:complete len:598 (+) Transcript_25323:25-1818(+)
MATTSVLYVHRRDAKTLKSRLEKESLLDKRFRMIPSASDAIVVLENSPHHHNDGESDLPTEGSAVDAIASGECIAVPVTDECIGRFETYIKESSKADTSGHGSWKTYAIASGRQLCPFSTSALGNQNHARTSRLVQQTCEGMRTEKSKRNYQTATKITNLTNIQCVVVETLVDYFTENTKQSDNTVNQEELESFQAMLETAVSSLSIKACPKKLEVMGDDRTLVVPSTAFLLQEKEPTNEFHQLLINISSQIHNSPDKTDHPTIYKIQENLWKNLASLYQSPRVVRRGDIDPESGVRESGHRILWPLPASITSLSNTSSQCTNHGYIPQSTGPDSSGWITVTEHKINQSFDLTRVMFSRGNVTEKKRFGLLVQPDEYVLDMYAGIGYYTLPSLIHGRARHVTACEWNPNAVFALRHNLKANRVDGRATVLEGDCRLTLRALMANIIDGNHHYFDRISLGLLPSSEGGWPIAIECLNRNKGGWLHVHGNVATTERQQWAHWLCRSLVCISKKNEYSIDWHAVCVHVEKVKSFAPKVDHYVADVFVGPLKSPLLSAKGVEDVNTTGVLHSGVFTATPLDVSAPSCALDTEGVIHQKWMM